MKQVKFKVIEHHKFMDHSDVILREIEKYLPKMYRNLVEVYGQSG